MLREEPEIGKTQEGPLLAVVYGKNVRIRKER
jgi:hypothetical protein